MSRPAITREAIYCFHEALALAMSRYEISLRILKDPASYVSTLSRTSEAAMSFARIQGILDVLDIVIKTSLVETDYPEEKQKLQDLVSRAKDLHEEV